MKGKLFILIIAILLGAFLLVLFLPSVTKKIPEQINPINSATLPGNQISPSTQGTIAITTLTDRNGTNVATRDFFHNGVTIADVANAGNYLLAGNLGYCLTDQQKCQAASSTNFSVYYMSSSQSFIITLTEEPIGLARVQMEQFLLSTLGLTQDQLCKLNYLVGVTQDVNPQFTGNNLGFSFCPGATVLPK